MKTPHPRPGQPTKYDPSYPDRLRAFFTRPPYQETSHGRVANDPPTLSGFAIDIGVSRDTLYEWGKKHRAFSDALKFWRECAHHYLVTCGLLGLTNSAITALELKNNHGYVDRQEVQTHGELFISYPPDWQALDPALSVRSGHRRKSLPAAPDAATGNGVGG